MKVIKLSNREVILSVKNLKQYFRSGSGKNKIVVKAVDDISFDIFKGEVFSLVGESGCGKTTTGRTIIKLYPSTGGEVHFHGTRIVSDVKQAKETYKSLLKRLNEDKATALADYKAQLDSNKITQEQYTEEVAKVNATFNVEKDAGFQVYRQAKRDRYFERQIDEDAREKAKAFTPESAEYQAIVTEYDELEIEIKADIDRLQSELTNGSLSKEKIKELKKDLKDQQRELKMNRVRMKQDISTHRYNLIHKNRLLMRKMQMIFQDPIASLNPRMTVKEIIAEGLRINGLKNEVVIDRMVKEALTTVGLVPEHASRYPHEFSGGQRQRIGIARALVVEPTFIIADEPISALDVSIRAQVINLLNDLRENKGITILFIAHDLSVVKYFSDRVAVMYFGRIVEMGDKDKIFHNPFHPYTLSLIDSIPLPDPTFEKARGKLANYNPMMEHDYSVDAPVLREVEPNHFVLCNQAEYDKYQEKLK